MELRILATGQRDNDWVMVSPPAVKISDGLTCHSESMLPRFLDPAATSTHLCELDYVASAIKKIGNWLTDDEWSEYKTDSKVMVQ
ncbi:MAG: hypothetical protein AWU57_1427 [Marinobacter sp. T13-3]|nr:MAG: hypothetical protein AWU57_1427 [Marinobacter sp. T13-3]